MGDDPIKGERKYNDPFMFDKKPLLLLAGNHPIRVNQIDREDAFYNRLITIPFANPVKNMSDAVVDLYKHFLEEAPYIVHEACLAYQDLANRNWVPTRVPVPDEYAPQEGNQSILAVKAFVKECILSKGDSQVSTADLYQAYMDYALEESFPQISSATFSRTLSTILNQVIPEAVQVKRVNGKEARGYSNITLI